MNTVPGLERRGGHYRKGRKTNDNLSKVSQKHSVDAHHYYIVLHARAAVDAAFRPY
jgi:hypothetical protein